MTRFSKLAIAAVGFSFAAGAVAQTNIKVVTAWSKGFIANDMYLDWVERVNKAGAGKVKIDVVGGPEVYPSFEQLEPLKRNVFQSVVTSTAYIAGALPETNATWFGFGATPEQLRAGGVIEALDKITREKAGVAVIGFPIWNRFGTYVNKPVTKADLTGLKMRSTPVYEPVLKALGATTVTIPPSEIVTALESGIVDGFSFPANDVVRPGFARAVKFRFEQPWWVAADIALFNAKAWDGLPADVRKILTDQMIAVEKDVPGYYLKKEKEEAERLDKMGIKAVELSKEDMARIQKAHWEVGTKTFLLDRSPKYGKELVQLMTKFAPK